MKMTATASLAAAMACLPATMMTRDAPTEQGQHQRGAPPPARGNRFAALTPSTYNAEAHTVELVMATSTPVRRYFGIEVLAMTPDAADLGRVARNLCPFLNAHNQWDVGAVFGRAIGARIDGGQLVGTVQFAQTPAGIEAEGMVARGELTGVSIGYAVRTWQLTESTEDFDTWTATSWELLEVSLVPVPADPNAGVRSVDTPPGTGAAGVIEEDEDMQTRSAGGPAAAPTAALPAAEPAAAPAAVRSEPAAPAPTPAIEPAPSARTLALVGVAAIRSAVANAGLAADVAFELIERHEATPLTNEVLMADIGRRFAERDQGRAAPTVNRVSVTRDAGDTMRRGMEDAVLHRLSPASELSEQGRVYRGFSLIRMAEEHLVASGVNVRGFSSVEIAERALHTTSDFANVLGNSLNRRLRMAYEENQPSYRQWARRAPNAPDFRSINVVQMSAMPDLIKVPESGEFKYGTASDGKVTYSVATYGRIIGISRQALINDDLRALERMTTGFAGSAARLENRMVYAILTDNAAMPDTVALFHADHGNLAGAGAISETTLAAGRGAMRVQKGLQAEELNLAPRYLIVPAALEQKAYQYTSSQFVPSTASAVNEFRAGGRTALEPIVEAVLDGSSASKWYLAAASDQVDTVEYCYLDGSEGVQMSSRIGFTVDGVEIKASLDFAAAAIDHRGLYRNG